MAAKYKKAWSIQAPRSGFENYVRSVQGRPLFLFSQLAFVAHTIGWIWGEMEGGDQTSEKKQGLKSPSAYIIVGDLDDIWDDSK